MREYLRSIWDEPRPPGAPTRVWRDYALVGALVPLAVLEVVLRPDLPGRTFWAVVIIGLIPTLLWRRTRPLLMLAVGFGLTGLAPFVVAAPESYTTAYLLILPYALYRWGSGRDLVLGTAIVLGKVGIAAGLGQLSAGQAVGGFAVLSSACALGAAFRYRTGARARQLDQVKLRERERLARDLHDTVAHHVSAVAIRAQAGLATAASDPQAAIDALHVIDAEAARALAEMRAMVRVLRRDEPADLAPNPGIAEIAQLANRADAGLPVDVEISGDVDGLQAAIGTAVYRLAQESVTNAQRHARNASRIEVRVAADQTSVRLRVSDDGRAVTGHQSMGYGLLGMIERVSLLGGVCEAGPNADRGWTVTATVPRTGSAAA